jgi:membrane-bound lytic murein transglycosylase A
LVTALSDPVPSDLPAGVSVRPIPYVDIAGWPADDHLDAWRAFALTCAPPSPLRGGAAAPPALASACAAMQREAPLNAAAARALFERWFDPLVIQPAGGTGFMTGYYEPEFQAGRTRSDRFPTPLYGRPPDLVTLDAAAASAAGLAGLAAARRLADGRLAPYATRAEIDAGALGADAPVVAWLADPVDRFVMQVQGSARLRWPDGSIARVAYAGRNGHPYVSLGRLMAQREGIPPAELTMDRLVARLKADPDVDRRWLAENPSFVFFRIADELSPDQGPIGGAGVPLTPGRSLAADRGVWAYGLPMWLDGALPTPDRNRTQPLRRLMVVQDTGSAIVGPARFDFFHGSGEAAGFVAGLTRHAVEAIVLWPRATPRDGVR